MNESEYLRLKQQIESTYLQDLAALERVYRLSQSLEPARPSTRTSAARRSLYPSIQQATAPSATTIAEAPQVSLPSAEKLPASEQSAEAAMESAESAAKGEVMKAAREAMIFLTNDTFTWKDIHAVMTDLSPDEVYHENSVRQAVRKLQERGEIEVASQGAGRTPTFYRIPARNSNTEVVAG